MTQVPAVNAFALSPDGAFLACADGPELLVYRSNGAPAWKQFCDDILAGVAATFDQVVTVDATGTLCRWRRDDGVLLEKSSIGALATGLAVAADGTLAVLTSTGPVLVRPGLPPQPIGVPGAVAVGFGPDGSSLGVGTSTGSFTAVDTMTGGAWGMLQLPCDRVGGVAWSERGFWLVSSGPAMALVQGDAQAVTATIPGEGPDFGSVGCSDGGIIAAATCGTNQVVAFDLHTHRTAGALSFRREVGQLAFGAGAVLGIGLDDGDATMVDLISGTPGRTEPHPGRGRNVWRMEDQIEHGILRGALAFHRAGTEPIARYIPRPDPYGPPPGQGGWMGACLGCVGMVVVIGGICLGILLLMYVIYAFGLFEAIPIR